MLIDMPYGHVYGHVYGPCVRGTRDRQSDEIRIMFVRVGIDVCHNTLHLQPSVVCAPAHTYVRAWM